MLNVFRIETQERDFSINRGFPLKRGFFIKYFFKDVHINRLAMKLDVHIQPIGKLRCMDVATCGRECYYCDWCRGSRCVCFSIRGIETAYQNSSVRVLTYNQQKLPKSSLGLGN